MNVIYPECQKVIALDGKKSTPFEMGDKLLCICVCNVMRKELYQKPAIHIQLLKPTDIVPFRRKSVYPGAFHIHHADKWYEVKGIVRKRGNAVATSE